MTRLLRFTCLLSLLSFLVFPSYLFADECAIDSGILDRGERKAFLICGNNITSDYKLAGLLESNIKVEYEQYLEMCNIDKDIPGIYLILKAEDNAKASTMSIVDNNTGKPLCENLNIEITDRIIIPEASFENLTTPDMPYKILNIKADNPGNFSFVRESEIKFPEGKWPAVSLLSNEDIDEIPQSQRLEIQQQLDARSSQENPASAQPLNKPVCNDSSIRALVKIRGQQQSPVKIIVEKIKLSGGEEKEGIAYAKLPPPPWAGSMKDEDAKYLDIDGIRTRYFDKGEGDALLLVHGGQAGGAGNAQSWEQNFYYLSKYFHVYALDRLGQGYTDNPKKEEDYDRHYEQVVEHVLGFIKAMGIKKVHLIGHSQGGWPVTRIAIDHPEMVKSLVNIDGAPAPVDPLRRSMPFFIYTLGFLNPPEGPTIESTRRGFELESYSLNNITDEKVARRFKLYNFAQDD